MWALFELTSLGPHKGKYLSLAHDPTRPHEDNAPKPTLSSISCPVPCQQAPPVTSVPHKSHTAPLGDTRKFLCLQSRETAISPVSQVQRNLKLRDCITLRTLKRPTSRHCSGARSRANCMSWRLIFICIDRQR